jgi:aminopeptidase N
MLGSASCFGQAVEPLRTAGDRPVDIRHIRLDLRVDLPQKTVDGIASLQVRSLRTLSSIALDAVDFDVKEVKVAPEGNNGDSTPTHFAHDGHKLVIDLEPAWPCGKAATLSIRYRVRNPKDGLYFYGPSTEEPDVPLTVWSQGEPITNRYWFPCLDQPNQRQTTELLATVADGFEVLSNGKLLERRANADKTVTFHWLQDKPHVAYLVTLVVGQFDIVREEWDNLPVLYYVPKGHKSEVARTFGRTREMLSYFSKRFGVRYPWDKYAQVVVEQFNAGGMENTSATTLIDWILQDERSILDDDPDWIIAHELAHQWWGDLVTCRDWSDLWLNEGFASYAEALWAEHHKGANDYAYNMWQKSGGARDQKRPVVDHFYPNPNSMFDNRSYPKGAWLLHMLRQRLGDEAFFQGLQTYATTYRMRTVDTNDFRKVLERETGRDLERFFYDWAQRAGNPVLEVHTEYLPETKTTRVVVKQTQAGEAFRFPLTLALHCPPASAPVISRQEVTDKEHTFTISVPGRPTLVEIDPEQAVLAEIKENQGRDLWLTQLTSAGVPGRIRAAQHFGKSKTPEDLEALVKAFAGEKFWGVQIEILNALSDAGGDGARQALIADLHHADPRIRRACAQHLGKFYHDKTVAAALKDILHKGDASYAVEAGALESYAHLQEADTVAVMLPWLAKPSQREVLRSAALRGLGHSNDIAALETLLAWAKRGKPRACRQAALDGLAKLSQAVALSDEQQKRVVAAITACLEGEGVRMRGSAIAALRELGKTALPAVPVLKALSAHDSSDHIRDQAKQAAEHITNATPLSAEVKALREQMESLKREQTTLRDRLNKYEQAERKGKK